VVGGIGQAALLPFLAFAPSVPTMTLALLLFGAFLGVIEVGMNVHAVEVEKQATKPLMSGFHGLFSVALVGFRGGEEHSHASKPAMSAVRRALPRRRALCTNWKKPR